MPRISSVQKAKDWLKMMNGNGIYFTPEEIKTMAMLPIGVPALARKLRSAREAGELIVRERKGKDYVEYSYNPSYTKPEAPRRLYFFTNLVSPIPSPYYRSVADLRSNPGYYKGCKIWTGTHESPLLCDSKGNIRGEE